MEVKRLRTSTREEASEALNWLKTVRAGKAEADHRDIEDEGKTAPKQQEGVPDDIEF